jgi:hypothetical protein
VSEIIRAAPHDARRRAVEPRQSHLDALHALGVHGDEKIPSQEEIELQGAQALLDAIYVGVAQHDHQAVIVGIYLGTILGIDQILDGEGMEVEQFTHLLDFGSFWSGEVEPEGHPGLADLRRKIGEGKVGQQPLALFIDKRSQGYHLALLVMWLKD